MKKNTIITITLVVFLLSIMFAAVSYGAIKIESIDKDRILAAGEEWKKNYTDFEVDSAILDTLKTKTGENLRIDIYLAIWCGDSRSNVPKFIKILDALEAQGLTVNYFTVERKPSSDVKYFVEELKVERVPTFIFYRGGKEIGRIIENPQKSLIEDFLDIVF